MFSVSVLLHPRSVKWSILSGDMINDRVSKGMKCMVSTMALSTEITLGIRLIRNLISLYRVMFLPVVTFNSGSCNNITNIEMNKLQVVQL